MVFVFQEQAVLFVWCSVISEEMKEKEFYLGSLVMDISYFFYTVTKDLTT